MPSTPESIGYKLESVQEARIQLMNLKKLKQVS